MRVLSLFSGGGLGDYGLTLAGMEIVGQVEWDEYCQKILRLRWPEVPKWEDVRNVTGEQVREKCGTVDLIAGGFPCQPFSVAGKKLGEKDKRNMWPEMHRVISEVKPAWVLAENVRGIVKPYLDTVLSDLESLGYSCLPLLIPASAIGAPHRRERLWIIAYSNDKRFGAGRHTERKNEDNISQIWEPQKDKQQRNIGEHRSGEMGEDVADTPRTAQRTGTQQRTNKEQNDRDKLWDDSGNCGETFGRFWTAGAGVRRVSDVCPSRVDRLKCLGNGQVALLVSWIGRMILEFENVSELF